MFYTDRLPSIMNHISLILFAGLCLLNIAWADETHLPRAVTVIPLVESIGHGKPAWTFEFVPDKAGVTKTEFSVDGQGQMHIFDEHGQLIQSTPVSISLLPISMPVDQPNSLDKLFELRDLNANGWKELLIHDYQDAKTANLFDEVYQYNQRAGKFIRIDLISLVGAMRQKSKRCIETITKIDYRTHLLNTFCYQQKAGHWAKRSSKQITQQF